MTGHYRDYCEARDWAPLRERMFQADLPDAMLEFFRSPRRNDIRRDGKNVRGFRGVKMKAWSGENVDAQDTTDRLGGSDDLPGRVPGERDSAAAW
jgi:hypothetical protein